MTFTIDASASTVCSIAGSTVSFIGTGTCVINANRGGDAQFYPAPQAQQSFSVGPNLVGDSYSAVGNTQLVAASHSAPTTPFTTDPDTILGNDTSDVAITLTTVTNAATTGGGLITIDAAGKFTYTPPVGQASGTDTYVYTGTSNGVSRTATITFTIANIVWYVNNASTGTHDGRSNTPFTHMGATADGLGSALSGTGPAAGAFIYVHLGSGAYTGNYTFKASQTLVGAGATLNVPTVSPVLTIAGNAANTPTLNSGLTLASSVSMTGLHMDGGAANLTGASITGFSVNIGRFRRTGSSSVTAISLTGSGNTGNFDFTSVSVTGVSGLSTSKGVSLSNLTGHFIVAGTDTALTPDGGTVSGFGGHGMEFFNVKNGASTAVSLTNMTLSGNAQTQAVTGADTNCGGNLLTGTNNSCVANLQLRDSDRIVLNTVTISGSGQMGLNGNNIDTLTITGSTISGNGNESFENGITIQNLKGTSAITNTSVKDNAARQIYVQNTTGTTTLTVQRTSGPAMIIGNSNRQSALPSQQGMLFSGTTATTMTLQVDGVTVQNNFGNGIQSNIEGASSLSGFIQNSSFTINAAGINLQANNSSTIDFDILNNPVFTGNQVQAINIGTALLSTGAVSVLIQGNTIGTLGVVGSACDLGFPVTPQENCAGITMSRFSTNPFTVKVTSNTIQEFGQNGITLLADETGSVNATLTSNTIRDPYYNVATLHAAGNALQSNIGSGVSANTTACVDISGNTIDGGDPSFGWDPNNTGAAVYTRARNGSTVSIPGYGGGDNQVNVQNFIIGANTITAPAIGVRVTADTVNGTFVNGSGACAVP